MATMLATGSGGEAAGADAVDRRALTDLRR
jgi:hypothetical protein